MKKLITYIPVLICFILASCTDNDVEPLFDKSVNERTAELKQEYYNILTSAENGWIGSYAPNEDFALYSVLMNFNSASSVTINSDYQAGGEDNTSTYRIDKTLKIELVLESEGVFHSIFALNNNGVDGEYVFNILSATEDEIVLESKLDFNDNITIFTLRKATAADIDFQPIYDSINNLVAGPLDSGTREVFLNGDVIAEFAFNENSRSITLTYDEDGETITQEVRVIFTATGFRLEKPLTINGAVLDSFNFDEPNNSYIEMTNTNLIIGDFIVCPIDLDAFVGTYAVDEGFYAGTNAGLTMSNFHGENYLMEITIDPTDVAGTRVLISNAAGYDSYFFDNTPMTFSTCAKTVSFDDDLPIALWQWFVVDATFYDEATHTIIVQGELGPYGRYQFILTKQ